MDRKRWAELCSRLECPEAESEQRFAVLEASYSESHRHYHTTGHIQECLALFSGVAGVAEHPNEVEYAIWLHDAIYRPRRSDNEERSAELAESWLRSCK